MTYDRAAHIEQVRKDGMIKDAGISQDGLYRYWLTRDWSEAAMTGQLGRAWSKADSKLPIIMLNPSTADGKEDDPTIRRCIGFAKAWGWGGIQVVNLFAYRATNPAALCAAQASGVDVVGPVNDRFIANMVQHACRLGTPEVLCAWGAAPWARERAKQVMAIVGSTARSLGATRDGSPRHPLYVPAIQPLVPYVGQGRARSRAWSRLDGKDLPT